MKPNKTKHIIGSIARTLLALTFIVSGVVKAIDPLGTTYKIEDYLKAFGGLFNSLLPLAETAAWIMIACEFVLGICLLLNIKTQATSWLTLLFYCFMTPLTLYLAIENPVTDCGCFGDAIILTNWQTFWKNVVLITLALLLVLFRKHVPQTWTTIVEWCTIIVSIILVCSFMLYTRLHLPLVDFRPYKIGNNIPELMEIPDDAPHDEYAISLIYRNKATGEEEEFTLQDYPSNNPEWEFIDQKSTLVKKGYEPPIHDFEILNADYEDVTYDILESDRRVNLVIMYDLDKADKGLMDKVTHLVHYALDNDEDLYILTGSGEQTIADFCQSVYNSDDEDNSPFFSPENYFYTCDPVTLKTIVRANPGVVVLEQGTIINKYNLRNK